MRKSKILVKKKIYFSDKKFILEAIKIKNSNLTNNIKLNIIKEVSGDKNMLPNLSFHQAKD